MDKISAEGIAEGQYMAAVETAYSDHERRVKESNAIREKEINAALDNYRVAVAAIRNTETPTAAERT